MISYRSAIQLLTGIISILLVFHLLILIKVIPYDITWGGRLKSDQEMYVFEAISLALNLLLLWTVRLKSRNSKSKLVHVVLWIFAVLFALNTVGNLLAETNFEKYFAIATVLLSLLLLRVLTAKEEK